MAIKGIKQSLVATPCVLEMDSTFLVAPAIIILKVLIFLVFKYRKPLKNTEKHFGKMVNKG